MAFDSKNKLNMQHSGPPKYFTRLLRYLCHNDHLEELEGDLEESYYKNIEQIGAKRARSIYRAEILKLLRPSVVKRKSIKQLNNIAMFKNYILTAFRNLSRHKLFTTINIVSLSVSMSIALLVMTFLIEVNSYDKFHQDHDRIYRLSNDLVSTSGDHYEYATSSFKAGHALMEEVPGIESVALVNKSFNGELNFANEFHRFEGLYVNTDFLDIFNFSVLRGNLSNVFDKPNSLIITETLALRIFNSTDVLGKNLKVEEQVFSVEAVLQKLPGNTHIKFDALASVSLLKQDKTKQNLFEWAGMWDSYIYFKTEPSFPIDQINFHLSRISQTKGNAIPNYDIVHTYQALSDIFPGTEKYNELGVIITKKQVTPLLYLASIVILLACFNYSNLSSARAFKRSKSVAIKKQIGARNRHVFFQFAFESVLVSFISLVAAFLLFKLIRPHFLSLDLLISQTVNLQINGQTYLLFILFALVIGLLAGALPAYSMTKVKANQSSQTTYPGSTYMKGFNFRNLLVGVQFTVSICFAVLVLLSSKLYNHAVNFDLGYETQFMYNIRLQGNDHQVSKSVLNKVSGVESISASGHIPSTGTLSVNPASIVGQPDSITVYYMQIDEDYIPNFEMKIIAGKNFNKNTAPGDIIVNEKFLKAFNIDPALGSDPIGLQVNYLNKTRRITGVVEDFHYGTLYNDIGPFALIFNDQRLWYLNLKLSPANLAATMSDLEEKWSEIDPERDLQGTFFDDRLAQTYQKLSKSTKIYSVLAIVSICIAALGLLGISVFHVQHKLKEITIRKVLGASSINLFRLITSGYFLLAVLATLTGIPVAIYIYNRFIGTNILYDIQVTVLEYGLAVFVVVLIGILSTLSQTVKVIRVNPAKTLRIE